MSIICEFRFNGVIIWHKGIITGNDLFQANNDIYSHEYDGDLKYQLIDLTEVDTLNVTTEEVTKLAKMDRDLKKNNKRFACVVAPTDFLFAMARTWNMQSEKDGFETHVVRAMDDAITWFNSKGINISL